MNSQDLAPPLAMHPSCLTGTSDAGTEARMLSQSRLMRPVACLLDMCPPQSGHPCECERFSCKRMRFQDLESFVREDSDVHDSVHLTVMDF